MKLSESKCVACEGGTSPMHGTLLKSFLKQVKGWTLEGNKIVKEFKFKDDKKALDFVNKTGKIAITEGHHPVTEWVYNKVKITFYTHAIGGLSKNDFVMAAKFDEVLKK